MRVPELGWPDDLFQDVTPVPDLPMTIAAQIQTEARRPLWSAMRDLWMPGLDTVRETAKA
jgi:hypothetical protein